MKKQILIMMFLSLAFLFAGMNKSYGQVLNPEPDALDAVPSYCVPAVPLTCGAGDKLSPAPGESYDYTVTVSGTPSQVVWFVTDDNAVMTAQEVFTASIDPGDASGDYILATNAAIYNSTTNTDVTIPITWKSFDGIANDVLLVVYAIDAAGCTDNVEVYKIEPKYSFTLDIAGIFDDGTEGATECVAPIQSATYDATLGELTVNYGTNYIYYTVNAANWQTSWMPDDFLAITDGGSTLGLPEWQYPDLATTGGAWNATDGTVEVLASHPAYITDGLSTDGFVGSDGACIIVRVEVDHGTTTENIANETINLTVNGEMVDPEAGTYAGLYPDLDEPAAGTDCINDLTTDNADYIITPRPTVTANDPTPFETKVPTGN